jgi:BirA family biotin operon repressor/biotin-[acetyl-CoA-carboxylase] ligase
VIEWNLPTQRIGQRTRVYPCVDSTNSLAASFADEPDAHGLAILTHEQTAGRGQHGRTWSAPPGSSVLLSIVLHPPAELRRPVLLTAWAAVSVCAVVQELTGSPCRIKWPNDVFLQGRKVCGILIEQGQATIAGIGLNVTQPAAFFAEAGLTEATSLVQHGVNATAEDVARRLLHELDGAWTALEAGEWELLESRWKWHLGVLGQVVRLECHEGDLVGRLLEVGFDGLALAEGGTVPRLVPCERVRRVTIQVAENSAS